MSKIVSATVDLPEGTVRYDRAGTTGDPVVLLHGGGLDNARLSWKHVIPALAGSHRVYAPDWPKHGGSWPWQTRADQQGLERCLAGLLDHWELPAATLIGLSIGGSVAIGFALGHPERVSRLVLANTGGIQERTRLHALTWFALQPPWPKLTGLTFSFRPVLACSMRRSTFKSPVDDLKEIIDQVHRELRAKRDGSPYSDWQRYEMGLRALKVNFMPRLGEIGCPTLLIHGEADDIVPVNHAREAATRLPDATLHLIAGCGHWSPRERPKELIAAIQKFLRS